MKRKTLSYLIIFMCCSLVSCSNEKEKISDTIYEENPFDVIGNLTFYHKDGRKDDEYINRLKEYIVSIKNPENIKSPNGLPALSSALEDIEGVAVLIEYVGQNKKYIQAKQLEIAAFMVKQGFNVNQLAELDGLSCSQLQLFVIFKNLAAIKFFTEHGADLNHKSDIKEDICNKSSLELARYLFKENKHADYIKIIKYLEKY